jgi:exosome complex RNA-binding protein Csl4
MLHKAQGVCMIEHSRMFQGASGRRVSEILKEGVIPIAIVISATTSSATVSCCHMRQTEQKHPSA